MLSFLPKVFVCVVALVLFYWHVIGVGREKVGFHDFKISLHYVSYDLLNRFGSTGYKLVTQNKINDVA